MFLRINAAARNESYTRSDARSGCRKCGTQPRFLWLFPAVLCLSRTFIRTTRVVGEQNRDHQSIAKCSDKDGRDAHEPYQQNPTTLEQQLGTSNTYSAGQWLC